MKLEFRLLGDVAVLADGQPLDLGGTRERSVFALLVLQRNRAVTTELLADRLWPDDQPLTAIKTIQVYVSRLRHALGPNADRLTSSPSGYRLVVADDELDAARFERGLRQARETLASGSPDAALAGLEDALALWSGPALGDLAGEPFARREADRLQELRLQAIEELFELRIGAGSGRDTIGELRRLTGEQPGRERLWRLLMLALYADGRQAEALQAYRDAHRYLADELGLDPGPELQELEHAILTQEAPRPRVTPLDLAAPATSAAPAGDAMAPPNLTSAGAVGVETAGHRTRRIVTVLRADIVQARDNPNLDPEILEALDLRALDVVRRAAERHGGTIDRTDGDGVTAIFGLTTTREDDALRAVRAAFDLRDEPPSADAGDALSFRVGVATGEVVTGSRDVHGSMISGAPPQVAAYLAARAAAHEVLLASETEQLVRETTSTERLSFEAGDGAPVSSAARLLAVIDGEAIARRTTTPFVGRLVELEALLDAFERVATEGTPGLATVIGAPGVGKSRLVAESLARISKRARILRSRCLPYGEGITYWPVRELVLAGAGIGHGEPRADALARLETIVAGLDRAELVRRRVASVLGLADDDAPAEEIQWAVRRFFEALAADRPLVLLVDDLQWAEPALVDLLEHVLDLGRGPLLLITIARPELEEAHPDWLARSSHSLIHLDSLNESDAATLLDHLAPQLPPGPLRSRILATAEGNPLFVEQFVAYVSDEAHATDRRLDDRTRADLPIPPTIGILLAARLDRVPDVERRMLARAAVIGRTFWAGALAELLSDDERADLSRHLARLARRDLIRPDRSDFPDDEAYRFRHLLIRDAAYGALPKSERAQLHERFADWLEGHGTTLLELDELLGYHLEQAAHYRRELGQLDDGLAERAGERLAAAGRRALWRGDESAAASLLGRALELTRPIRRDVHLEVDLAYAVGIVDPRRAVTIAEAAAAQAQAAGDVLGEALARVARAYHRQRMGEIDLDELESLARATLPVLEGVEDHAGLARVWEALAFGVANGRGRFEEMARACEQALRHAEHGGQRFGSALQELGMALVLGPRPADEALRALDALLRESPRPWLLLYRAYLLAMLGRSEEARPSPRELCELIREIGSGPGEGMAARIAALEGDHETAARYLRAMCNELEERGERAYLSTFAPLLGRSLCALGRYGEAEPLARLGRELGDERDALTQMGWRQVQALVDAHRGEYEEAERLVREAVSIGDQTDALDLQGDALRDLAEVLRAAGKNREAAAALVQALERYERKKNVPMARQVRALLRRDRAAAV